MHDLVARDVRTIDRAVRSQGWFSEVTVRGAAVALGDAERHDAIDSQTPVLA